MAACIILVGWLGELGTYQRDCHAGLQPCGALAPAVHSCHFRCNEVIEPLLVSYTIYAQKVVSKYSYDRPVSSLFGLVTLLVLVEHPEVPPDLSTAKNAKEKARSNTTLLIGLVIIKSDLNSPLLKFDIILNSNCVVYRLE